MPIPIMDIVFRGSFSMILSPSTVLPPNDSRLSGSAEGAVRSKRRLGRHPARPVTTPASAPPSLPTPHALLPGRPGSTGASSPPCPRVLVHRRACGERRAFRTPSAGLCRKPADAKPACGRSPNPESCVPMTLRQGPDHPSLDIPTTSRTRQNLHHRSRNESVD